SVLRAERNRGAEDYQQSSGRGAGARGGAEGALLTAAKRSAGFRRSARQAGGLLRARSQSLRIVSGGGRVRWWNREAGTRPAIPGDSAVEGQDPQRRKSPLRQDAGARGNSRHDYRSRYGYRQG